MSEPSKSTRHSGEQLDKTDAAVGAADASASVESDCPAEFMSTAQRLNRRIKRGGAWVLAGRVACMATIVGIYALLARVLPMGEVAAYGITASIAVFHSMAAMFGLNTLVCRYISESFGVGDTHRAAQAKRISLQLSAVSVSVVGLLGYCSARFLGESVFGMPLIANSAGLIAIWIMLLAISQIVAEAFRGLQKLRVAGVLGGVSGGLLANGLLLFNIVACRFVLGIDVDLGLVITLTAVSLFFPTAVAIAYLNITWPRESSVEPSGRQFESLTWQSVIREAVPVMLVQLIGFGMAQLDIWIVGAVCGETDVATYVYIRRLSLLVAVPLTQIGLVVGSSISELHARGDHQNLQRILKAAATVGILAMGIPALVLVAFPETVLTLLFGEPFRAGATPLRIILAGQLVYVFTGLCGPTLMMTGRHRVPLWSLVATLPVLVLTPWAAVHYGLSAVACLFAITTAVQNLVQWCVVRLMMGIETHPDLSPRYLSQLCHAGCR